MPKHESDTATVVYSATYMYIANWLCCWYERSSSIDCFSTHLVAVKTNAIAQLIGLAFLGYIRVASGCGLAVWWGRRRGRGREREGEGGRGEKVCVCVSVCVSLYMWEWRGEGRREIGQREKKASHYYGMEETKLYNLIHYTLSFISLSQLAAGVADTSEEGNLHSN